MDIFNVPLQLRDDVILKKKKQYRISIENIKAFSPYNRTLVRTDALTSIEGEPITITVYVNECEYTVERLCKDTCEWKTPPLIRTTCMCMHNPSCLDNYTKFNLLL